MKVLSAPSPKSRRKLLSAFPGTGRMLSGGLLTLTLLVSACQNDGQSQAAVSPAKVGVAAVLSKRVMLWDEFNGRIRAIDSVELRPRISGYVQRIAYKEGDEVRKGDLLFLIDQRPYRAALDSALARLDHVRATVALAQSEDHRAQSLLKVNAVSKEEAERRHATYMQGAADVRDAEAAAAVARLNMEFTEVRAPIDGRVSRAMLTVGNLAVADQTMLTTIVSQDPVYVYFDPDEHSFLRYGAGVHPRQDSAGTPEVQVGLANENDFSHRGVVDFIDNQVNPDTGTIRARARLGNADRVFTPGLYARVKYSGGLETDVLLIDDKAVLTDQDRKYVYVLGTGNKAIRKDVQLGGMSEGLRVVEKGLEPGEKVIVAGVQHIFYPGAPVVPTEIPMGATATNTSTPDMAAAVKE